MSSTVDNKVVKLTMDSKQFERNAKNVTSVLEKLKEKLNFKNAGKTFDGLTKSAKKVDLSAIGKSADVVQEKFKAMDIAWYTVVNRMTNWAIDKGQAIAKALWDPITTGGKQRASNIEQALFQLSGIYKENYATEYNKYMTTGLDDISSKTLQAFKAADEAVTGTAYGLDEAAVAAGQLAASGIDIEKMSQTLRAIAGTAAMTGRGYSDIANIFTTVAGQSKVMTMQLRMLENSGINAAATIAEQFGATEADIREAVTRGEIDFEMFSTAMFNAYGEQAAKANETYSGSLSNMQAALKRIGQDFYLPLHYHMIKPLNEVRLAINDIRTALKPASKEIADVMGKLENISIHLIHFMAQGITPAIGNMAKAISNLISKAVLLVYDSRTLQNIFVGVGNVFKAVGKIISTVAKTFSVFHKATEPSRFAIRSITYSFKEFTKSLIMTDEQTRNWTRTFIALGYVLKTVLDIVKPIVKMVFTVGQAILQLVYNLGKLFTPLVMITKRSNELIESTGIWTDIIEGITKGIIWVINGLSKLIDIVAETIGWFSKSVTVPFLDIILKQVSETYAGFKAFVKGIKDLFGAVFKSIEDRLHPFATIIDLIKRALESLKNVLGDVLSNIFGFGTKINSLGDVFLYLGNKISAMAKNIATNPKAAFNTLLDDIKNLGIKATDFLYKPFSSLKKIIESVFGDLGKTISPVLDSISNIFISFKDKIVSAFSTAMSVPGTFIDKIKVAGEKIVDAFGWVGEALSKAFGKIKEIFQSVSDVLNKFFKNTTFLDILTGAEMASGTLAIIKFSNAWKTFSEAFGNGQGPLAQLAQLANFGRNFGNNFANTLGESLKTLAESLSGLQKDVKPKLVLAIGASLLMLAAGMYVISQVNPKDIKSSLLAVSLLVGEITAATIAISRFSKGGTSQSIGASIAMIAFAGAIAILVHALKNVTDIVGSQGKKELWTGVKALTVLIGAFTASMAILIKTMNGATTQTKTTTTLVGKLIEPMKKVGGVFGKVGNTITTKFEKPIGKLHGAFSKITGKIPGVNKVVGNFGSTIDTLKGKIEEVSTKTKQASKLGSFVGLGIAMLVFVAAIKKLTDSLVVLATLDTGQLVQGLIAIGILITGLVVAMKQLDKIDSNKISTSMLKIAGVMLMLSLPIKIMGEMGLGKVVQGGVALLTVVGMLTGAMVILSKYGKEAYNGAVGAKAIAKAVKALMVPIIILSLMKFGKILQGVLSVELIILSLTSAMVILAKFIGQYNSQITQMEPTIMAFAKAVNLLMLPVLILSKMPIKGVLTATASLIAMMAGLIIAMNYMKNVIAAGDDKGGKKFTEKRIETMNKLAKTMRTLGLAMVPFAASIFILCGAINLLGKMKLSDLAAGIGGLMLTLTAMVGVMWALSKMDMSNVAKGFLLVGAAILALGLGINLVVKAVVSLVALGAGAAAVIVEILASVGLGLAKALEFIGTGLARMFINFSNIIVQNGETLYNLGKTIATKLFMGFVDGITEDAIKTVEDIVKIIDTVLDAVVKNAASWTDKLLTGLITVIRTLRTKLDVLVPEIIYLIADTFNLIKKTLKEYSDANLASVLLGMAAVMGLFVIISKFKSQIKQAIVPLTIMIVAMGLMTAIFYVLGSIDASNLLPNLAGLMAALVGMAVVCDILSYIPVTGALMACANLAILIGALTLIVVAMGAIAQIPGVKWLMDEGAKLLAKLGEAIGGFVGGIVAGFAKIASSALPVLGANLGAFGIGIKPFISSINKIKPSTLACAYLLAGAIGIILGESVLDSIATFLGFGKSPLESFGENVSKMADGIAEFAKKMDGVDVKSAKTGAQAGMYLAKMLEAMPNSGGIVSWFTGDNADYEGFAKSIEGFGESIATFGKSMNQEGIDFKKIKSGAKAGILFAEMLEAMPNSGGLISKFTGDNADYDGFSKAIKQFGVAIATFGVCMNLEGVDFKKIQNGAKAGIKFAEMLEAMPNTGGLISKFTGDNSDYEGFANAIKGFGSAIATFSMFMIPVKFEDVDKGVKVVHRFIDLAEDIPKFGGLKSLFEGSTDYIGFTSGIKVMGEAINSFNTSIANTKEGSDEKINSAISTLKGMSELSKNIPTADVFDVFTGIPAYDTFSTGIVSMGNAVVDFNDSITGTKKKPVEFNQSNIDTVVKTLIGLVKVANTVPKEGVFDRFKGIPAYDEFKTGIESLGDAAASFAGKFTRVVLNTEKVEAAIMAVKGLSEVSKNLPSSKAFVGYEDFSEGCGYIGDGVASFTNKLTYAGDMSRAKDAIPVVNSLKNIFDKIDGVDFDNTEDFEDFETSCSHIGAGVGNYSRIITESVSDVDKIKNSISIAESLIRAFSKIPKSGSFTSIDSNGFKDGCSAMADGVSAFSAKATYMIMNPEKLENAAKAVDTLASAANKLPTNSPNYDDFSEGIPKVGDAITTFNDSIKNISLEDIKSSLEVGKEVVVSFKDGLKTGVTKDTLQKIGINRVKWFDGGAESWIKKGKPKATGKHLIEGFQSGIRSISRDTFTKMGSNRVDDFIKGLESNSTSNYDKAHTAGSNVVSGFKQGISDTIPTLDAATTELSDGVIKAIKKKLKIKSPSRVTKKLGGFTGEGFVNGFVDTFKMVEKSIDNMSDIVVNGITNTMYLAKSIAESDLDLQPTITPVIDMSSINSSINDINRALNNRTFAIAGNINMSNRNDLLSDIMSSAFNMDDFKTYIGNLILADRSVPYEINVPLDIDGREFARANATFMRTELDRQSMFNSMMEGIKP